MNAGGRSAQNFVYDRLYGQISVSESELRLFQTKELTRLRHVSLSAIPTWTLPAGVCSSKFEHSVGVGHLAKIVGARPEFKDVAQDLYFASLAHDLGTPPFSHASEYFQIKVLGKTHEAFIDDIVEGSEFSKEVTAQGGNIDRVVAMVKGEDTPFSDLVNGTIDVDNLDNTLRFGLSMGLLTKPSYDPEDLARAYAMRDGRLVLLGEHTKGLAEWEHTRHEVYEFVFGEMNLATGAILIRALDFARREGKITKDYFLMTDEQAFYYLSTKCNERTKTLMDRADRWIFYERAFNFKASDVSQKMVDYIMDSDNRGVLADEIAEKLKIPPEDVCVYMGKDKGYKKVHLPIVGEGKDRHHEPQVKLSYMAQVYVHPKWVDKVKDIQEAVGDRFSVKL